MHTELAGFRSAASLPLESCLLTAVFFFDEARQALRRNLPVLALAAGLAVLGTFVSIVNGTPAGAILQSLTETHVQAAIIIVVAAVLAQVAGARACTFAIVAVIGISACVALAQMMDLEPAWSLRRALGPLPAEATEGLELLDRRPTGLSFSAIQLSTQLCLAFAAFVAVRDKVRRQTDASSPADPAVILALLAFFAASIVVATRSPILGGLCISFDLQPAAAQLMVAAGPHPDSRPAVHGLAPGDRRHRS